MDIGGKLRLWSSNIYSKHEDLAKELEIKSPNLYAYFSNKVIPGAKVLRKLATLGCDTNWLLSEDGEYSVTENIIFSRNRIHESEKGDFLKDEYEAKIKELEEENRLLRDRISQITALTQAIEISKKRNKLSLSK